MGIERTFLFVICIIILIFFVIILYVCHVASKELKRQKMIPEPNFFDGTIVNAYTTAPTPMMASLSASAQPGNIVEFSGDLNNLYVTMRLDDESIRTFQCTRDVYSIAYQNIDKRATLYINQSTNKFNSESNKVDKIDIH